MSQPMLPIHGTGPSPASIIPGHIISASSNVMLAMAKMVDYFKSTNDLQTEDTKLEAAISNAETEEVAQFQEGLNAGGTNLEKGSNYLYLLENLAAVLKANGKNIDPTSNEYQHYEKVLSDELSAAQSENQAKVKVMDGNNSTAQNVLSQNSQNQPGILQAMSSINGIAGNLARILQG